MTSCSIMCCPTTFSSHRHGLKRGIYLLLLTIVTACLPHSADAAEVEPLAEAVGVNAAIASSMNFGNLPLYFIANQGQLDSRVGYYVQGRDSLIYFTSEGITFVFTTPSSPS